MKFFDETGIAIVKVPQILNSEQKKKEALFTFYYYTHTQNASLVDYELCLTVLHLPKLWLVSGNSRDIPQQIFEREDVLVFDRKTSVHPEFVYRLNMEKFKKETAHLKF